MTIADIHLVTFVDGMAAALQKEGIEGNIVFDSYENLKALGARVYALPGI